MDWYLYSPHYFLNLDYELSRRALKVNYTFKKRALGPVPVTFWSLNFF